jgi:hypothetical protein
MAIHIRRREFIVALGGTAVAWPLAPRAEQPEPMRRIGVMIEFDEKDPEAKAYPSGLTRGLAQLGWIDGRNVRIDIRWAAANVERMQVFAKELVDLRPDVIVTSSTPVTAAVQRETQTIPIVFVTVADPIGAGFVASLPHPGGNSHWLRKFGKIDCRQVSGVADGHSAQRQASRRDIQSGHKSRRRIVFSALIRGGCPIAQRRTDHSASSQRR